MRPLVVFQHATHEGPGLFAEHAEARGFTVHVIRAWRGGQLPDDPSVAAGLVFMGGPMSVNDPLPFIAHELRLIARAAEVGVPLLGHCLGGQLIARALGGVVSRSPASEIGWFPVNRVSGGPGARYWLRDTPDRFEAFHWHGETFSLPPAAELLWSSTACAHQAFCIGRSIFAMQCHVEMTAAMIGEWVGLGGSELQSERASIQDRETICALTPSRLPVMQQVARQLYDRWLSAVVPVPGRTPTSH